MSEQEQIEKMKTVQYWMDKCHQMRDIHYKVAKVRDIQLAEAHKRIADLETIFREEIRRLDDDDLNIQLDLKDMRIEVLKSRIDTLTAELNDAHLRRDITDRAEELLTSRPTPSELLAKSYASETKTCICATESKLKCPAHPTNEPPETGTVCPCATDDVENWCGRCSANFRVVKGYCRPLCQHCGGFGRIPQQEGTTP